MFGRSIALWGLLLLAACDRAPKPPSVAVENMVVTVPAIPGAPGAAYFRLSSNHGPVRLISVSTPSARRVELQGTGEGDGVTRMALMGPAQLSFDHRPLDFDPNGNHAMLFDVDPNLLPGGRAALTFTFEPAPTATVEEQVRGPGQARRLH